MTSRETGLTGRAAQEALTCSTTDRDTGWKASAAEATSGIVGIHRTSNLYQRANADGLVVSVGTSDTASEQCSRATSLPHGPSNLSLHRLNRPAIVLRRGTCWPLCFHGHIPAVATTKYAQQWLEDQDRGCDAWLVGVEPVSIRARLGPS